MNLKPHISLPGAILLLLTARPAFASGPQEAGREAIPGQTRTVEHSFGTTHVPLDPERIAALGQLASTYALELGIVPVVGTTEGIEWSAEFADRFAVDTEIRDIPTAGTRQRINIEAVATANPDLIVTAANIGRSTYRNLSRIAPTVVLQRGDNADWESRYDEFADAVGRSASLEELRERYRRTLSRSFDGATALVFAFIRPREGGDFRVDIGDGAFPASVARDAGLRVLAPPEGVQELWNPGSGVYQFSPERLRVVADADVIVFPEVSTVMSEGGPSEPLFDQNPLWRLLPAVRAGNTVPVPALAYNGGSYTAAMVLLEAMHAALAAPSSDG